MLDPRCQDIVEVHNASCDVVIIEQLFADMYENSVFFQCQALRCLARSFGGGDSATSASSGVGAVAGIGSIGPAGSAANLEGGASGFAQTMPDDILPEKSTKMQLKAMLDCLLGAPTHVVDSKCTNGSFCSYVRAEAAFALAQWQNTNAPQNIATEHQPKVWQGMYLLLNCLLSMYAHPITMLPTHVDASDESALLLRNALILALSQIRAESGHTPMVAVETLLAFAKHVDATTDDPDDEDGLGPVGGTGRGASDNDDDDEEDNDSDDGADGYSSPDEFTPYHYTGAASTSAARATSTTTKGRGVRNVSFATKKPLGGGPARSKSNATVASRSQKGQGRSNKSSSNLTSSKPSAPHLQYDNTHYRAVLFLALSRAQFESMVPPVVTGAPSAHPMHEIVSLASSAVRVAITQARAAARISYLPGEANLLPQLPGQGIDLAAAITCLAEMDVQALRLYARGRGQLSPTEARQLDLSGPTGKGILSGFDYTKHFLSPSVKLMCLTDLGTDSGSGGTVSGKAGEPTLKDFVSFQLCTPVMRAAAFEGFLRVCFAAHEVYMQRLETASKRRSTSNLAAGNDTSSGRNDSNEQQLLAEKKEASQYVAATVEALRELFLTETNDWVRQQAALVLADAMMDQSARIAAQALSLGSPWSCLGWYDPCAFSQPVGRSAAHGDAGDAGDIIGMGRGTGTLSTGTLGTGAPYMQGQGPYLRIAMKILWRTIVGSTSANTQVGLNHTCVNH